MWAGSPWVFLPLPLLLFFLATFCAEETAQDGTLWAPGLTCVLPSLREAGLMNGPLFLMMACWRMSNAAVTFPYPRMISMLLLTIPETMV